MTAYFSLNLSLMTPALLRLIVGILFLLAFSAQAQPGRLPVVDSLERADSLASPAPQADSPRSNFSEPELGDTLIMLSARAWREAQARQDSLLQVQQRLATAARRRLRMASFVDSFRTYPFYTCVVAPEHRQIELFNPLKRRQVHTFASVEALAQERGQELLFAMNAGMFEPDRQAKGLLVLEGEVVQPLDTATRGYGNFYLQPNGVFALDSQQRAYVVPTQAYAALADTTGIRLATQSGPMLLVQGRINPQFNDGSPNRYVRNAVGVTPDNQVVFAMSRRPVTFFALTSFMIRQGCTDALYLDGAISQMYLPELGLDDLAVGDRLGPILAIMATSTNRQ